jgi:uncharacterized surface protein with fasciclin (FAS1) repeats
MAGETAGETGGEEMMTKNIVETAVDAGDFTTLVAAVQAAELVDLLSGEGPFTVLAPNDEAFAVLPEGTVETLVADAEAGGSLLADILKLHVVAGAGVLSTDLTDGQVVTTANGDLTVSAPEGGPVTFTSGDTTAEVITADIPASNGVIHVINAVLLPVEEGPTMNIVETAVDNGSFEILVAAVQAAGFVDVLSGDGPFTVFAPTDDAFAALPEGTVEMLVMDAQMGGTLLADILNLHVVADAAVLSTDLSDGQVVTTLNGDLTVGISEGTVTLTSTGATATVVSPDVLATNGVIHVIDAVLVNAE